MGWPLAGAFAGYAVFWGLGFSPFVWIAFSVPMATSLLMRRRVAVPRGFGIWALFLLWVALSTTQVDSGGRLLAAVFRAGEYLAAGIVLVYVYNLDPRDYPTHRGIRLLVISWVAVVAGGYLALVLPDGQLPNIAGRLLPASLAGNEFVSTLMTPRFAQVQDFLGFPLPRPAAPFTYTNTWGSAYALLLPWVLAVVLTKGVRREKRLLRYALIVGSVPGIVSVNRGMWVSIAGMVVILILQTQDSRLRRLLPWIVGAIVSVVTVVALTPLASIVTDRISTGHSNNARLDIAEQTTERAMDSPLLGFGGPRPYEGPGIRPPVGTQGHLWLVLFSHGLPGLALYLVFFLYAAWSIRGSDTALWMRMMLLALALQMPFYNHGGAPLMYVMLGLGITFRVRDRKRGANSLSRLYSVATPS